MSDRPIAAFLSRLAARTADEPDADLLRRFAAERDGAAFAELVRRHGPMVYGVARRLLPEAAADDAFQAAFLVLVRRADAVGRPDRLANWLYGVTLRVARRARQTAARRRECDLAECEAPAAAALDPDLAAHVHEQVGRLPEHYRRAVLACYLGGRTHEEAARELGWPVGTVKGRLARARELLRRRLGGCEPAVFLAPLAVPAALARAAWAAPTTVAGADRPAHALAEEAVRSMFVTRITVKLTAALSAGLLIAFAGVLALGQAQPPAAPKPPAPAPEKPAAPKADEDAKRLQGVWDLVEQEWGGEKTPLERALFTRLVFAGDTAVHEGKKFRVEGTFRLGPAKQPATIDLLFGSGQNLRMYGIYKYEKDRLTVCYAPYEEAARPTKFATRKPSPAIMLTFKRVSEKEAAPADEAAKKKRARLVAGGRLFSMALAMHNYHDANEHFPPAALHSKDGKPVLSWRVALLPHLGEKELYEQFKLDEPWDSEHNKTLLTKVPKVYAPLGEKPDMEGGTFYQVFTGDGTIFDNKKGRTVRDVADGTSNTLMIVEGAEAVPWTKPADIAFDPTKPLPVLGGMLRDGLFAFALADGSVHWTRNSIGADALRKFITRSDGEVIDFRDLDIDQDR